MKLEKRFWERVLSSICLLVFLVLHLALSALLDSMYATGLLRRPTADEIALRDRMLNGWLRATLVLIAIPGIPLVAYVAGLTMLDRMYPDEKRKNSPPAPSDDAGAAMEILMRDADGEDTKNSHGT